MLSLPDSLPATAEQHSASDHATVLVDDNGRGIVSCHNLATIWPYALLASPQNGWTPLHGACWKGHKDIAQLLLDHGEGVDIGNKVRMPVMCIAVFYQSNGHCKQGKNACHVHCFVISVKWFHDTEPSRLLTVEQVQRPTLHPRKGSKVYKHKMCFISPEI